MTGKEVLDLVRETWRRAPDLQKWCDFADVVHRDGFNNGREYERNKRVAATPTATPLISFGSGGATLNLTVNLTLFGKRS